MSGSLAVRENAERPEAQSWPGIDAGTRGHDVADHRVVVHRDQRQLRNPPSIVSEPGDQRGFTWVPTWLDRRCAERDAPEQAHRQRGRAGRRAQGWATSRPLISSAVTRTQKLSTLVSSQ